MENRTIEVVFGTDKPVRMNTWEYGTINEILSFDPSHVRMDRLNGGGPVLDNHTAYGSVAEILAGVVERAWAEGGKGYAKLRFAQTAKGQQMLDMARDGILQNVSVGYQVYKYKRTKAGTEGEFDTYRAVDWEPYEISMVAIPADSDAKARSMGGAEDMVIEDDAVMTADPKAAMIEMCTDAIDELNEGVSNYNAYAESDPDNADLYTAVADALKSAIAAHLEIIAALNGQRSNKDIINQRRLQAKSLIARFPNK